MRIPGIFWGYNFPTGWKIHHVDEYSHLQNTKFLIHPSLPKWVHPYPKGMAAHVAIPLLVKRALKGQSLAKPPEHLDIINITVIGRVVSVLYGVATVLVVFLLTKHLIRDQRVALFAAWILALGGLHVSQSHFFLSDIPSLFYFLLGLYLLFLELESVDKNGFPFLTAASFCFGIAFGIKLIVASLPTLAIVAVIRKPKVIRVIYIGVFFLAGFVVVNAASYTLTDLYKTFARGISDPYQWSVWTNILLYLLELPSLISFPILLFAFSGFYFLGKKFFIKKKSARFWPIILIVILPLAINILLVACKLDHFPRHLITFIPWIAISAAYSLVKLSDKMKTTRFKYGLLIIPLFAYLGLFVYDGEKAFIQEPRNEAARWILQNVTPGTPIYWRTPDKLKDYPYVHFPEYGRPPVLVIQMDRANHYLSGMGLKNSYPKDYRRIFDSESQARIEDLQAVIRGKTEYKEVIRFKEGYFMPEYILTDTLIGNRSRNYVAEIVIFERDNDFDHLTAHEIRPSPDGAQK